MLVYLERGNSVAKHPALAPRAFQSGVASRPPHAALNTTMQSHRYFG